ncbi:phenylalanine 4-monooxygenase [Sphingomonas crocodyli]|uniref:Phenylalanine-4-hydroxylase n=1 Tax=Sphingomonas crocodyli TaxID=1979270 RepID=A0A437M7J8_9SPHN|nr:phenylalanine 4-monooxygenase [Sphingomonas crocodyli]RVT93526.1 phenylalanine 4-monooxygenase [Sphingomonas crocodyli]
MAVTHVYETPPEGVASDWTMPQNWDRFTDAEHATWDRLVAQQSRALDGLACSAFLSGLDILRLSKPGIPDLRELNARLGAATGWEIVAVPGVIPNQPFFEHLAERRFPAANFLRSADSLDYSEEPDMFHDLFGHLPTLTDPVFADFMMAYGKAGLRAEKLGATDYLGRLYLHTVEFGIVRENGSLRGFGAGMLSSYSETVHALTSPNVRRLTFDLSRVMQTDYLFDKFQPTYFVIDSFEHLLKVTSQTDFGPIYERLQGQPLLAADAECEGDILAA